MAQYSNISVVKLVTLVVVSGFFVYLLGPPLYWHFAGDESSRIGSVCPMCECPGVDDEGTRSALADLSNATFPDCPKNDEDLTDEVAKTRYQKLQEEMATHESVAKQEQDRLQELYLDMKKSSSTYQKEAEKCNSGMESSEGAREKAEQLLAQEKKNSAKWEAIAKQLGWKEEDIPEEERREDQEQEEVEEVADDMPTARKPKNDQRNVKMSPKNQKVIAEFEQNMAVAHYIVQRAVDNEMSGLQDAKKHAEDLHLV